MRIYQIGEEIKQNLTFTQKELDLFSTLSKDLNPIHSSEYASTHNLKGSLVQGMLAAARFGEIFGTIFPGTGTINMERNFTFLRPLYTGENYFISVILTDVDLANNIGIMKLSITDANGNIYVLGETKTKNTEVFTVNNYPISEQTSSSASPLAIVQLPSPIDGNLSPLHEILKKDAQKDITARMRLTCNNWRIYYGRQQVLPNAQNMKMGNNLIYLQIQRQAIIKKLSYMFLMHMVFSIITL